MSANPTYMAYALCRNIDHIDFYSQDVKQIKTAVAFCRACPVVDSCLQYAIENNIFHGVWGGKSAYQRRKLIAVTSE